MKPNVEKHRTRTDYLGMVYRLHRFIPIFETTVKALKRLDKKTPFDAIAFTGTSGAALAYPLSLRLKKPLISIRKGQSHFGRTFEGCLDAKSYLIIDDFIDGGATVNRILREVRKVSKAVPMGIYLYAPIDYTRKWYWKELSVPIFTARRLKQKSKSS